MVLFFDTETTGIRRGGFIPRVIQIGALLTDDEGLTRAELNLILFPKGFVVPVDAANVHGITTEIAEQFGINREIGLHTFFELADLADTLVAHNIEYDLDLLNIEIRAYNGGDHVTKDLWQKSLDDTQKFCTMLNARDTLQLPLSFAQASFFKDKGINQKYKNPKLIEAYQHFFHKDFEGAHDAMADVRACKDVYFKLHELKTAASEN